ncbi:c-type cytochrome [Tabrizicola sp. J26]|uniref:c-type cytochrome n=1 Tax=Alitabrizicola rongguiensis TaxID=2909234 RepID=UPI001F2FA199|nr:c-type cytochrome [Tabrizicola rongguiensis]MCF1710681.1 c-type cytochrome [Tabrizicola rongguiensis]
MKLSLITIAVLATAAAPAFAAGDVEAGKKVFNQCQTCHTVTDPSGAVLAGKNSKVGPNLYGIIGRPAASYEGFKYGDGIKAAAEKGLVWDEEKISVYVMNPTKFLDEFTGDPKLKSKMAFKLAKPDDGVNVAAFLASLSPAPADAAAPAEGAATTSP